MAAPAVTLEQVAEQLQQLLERAQRATYSETDVLTPEELATALKIGKTKVFQVMPKLPVSYALGDHLPRFIWGDVLQYLRDTNINK